MTLSTAYLPTIGYMRAVLRAEEVEIDLGEHFVKRSERSRCIISNGGREVMLSVPVSAAEGYDQLSHVPMSEVRIAREGRWREVHAEALRSAYGKTPYFDYYEDLILPIYEGGQERLWELNKALLEVVMRLLDIETEKVRYTERYDAGKVTLEELRQGKVGDWEAGACVLDMLMELGPEARLLLLNG